MDYNRSNKEIFIPKYTHNTLFNIHIYDKSLMLHLSESQRKLYRVEIVQTSYILRIFRPAVIVYILNPALRKALDQSTLGTESKY